MSGPLPPPSATGVITAGYRFQWLLVWQGCVQALLDAANRVENPIVSIGVEVDDAGNLDDLVLYHQLPPHSYKQVKYSVDDRSSVNFDYLSGPSKAGGPSILAKIARTWLELTATGEPVDLALVTNRHPDSGDALIAGRDKRTRLLLPRASGPGRRLADERQRWAQAAELTEEKLAEMLAVLDFDLGRDVGHLAQETQYAMAAAGLKSDEEGLNAGIDWVARQVIAGQRQLGLTDIHEAIDTVGLRLEGTRTIVSVATLLPDPLASHSTYSVDWVDRFDGDDPALKRHPKAPATWAQLQDDIEAIPAHVAKGPVTITGTVRLAPAFAVGAALRMVTGYDVATVQRGTLWGSDEPFDAPTAPVVAVHDVGRGDDLAIALEISTTITEDVLAYIASEQLPVGRLVSLRPADGPNNNAVPGPAAACSWAEGVRNTVRQQVKGHRHIHLFIAAPMGLALLLGHRWNRLAPTVVYEDLANLGYEAAFTVMA